MDIFIEELIDGLTEDQVNVVLSLLKEDMERH